MYTVLLFDTLVIVHVHYVYCILVCIISSGGIQKHCDRHREFRTMLEMVWSLCLLDLTEV